MPVYAFEDREPRIDPSAYLHPAAVVIGAVTIGPRASIWPNAVLRADFGVISVGERTSVQDGTVLHTTHEWPTVIGAGCVVGHLEGCVVEDGCLIGSGSVVLNRARVGSGSVVGAGALVREDLRIPPNHLVLGVPRAGPPAAIVDVCTTRGQALGEFRSAVARQGCFTVGCIFAGRSRERLFHSGTPSVPRALTSSFSATPEPPRPRGPGREAGQTLRSRGDIMRAVAPFGDQGLPGAGS